MNGNFLSLWDIPVLAAAAFALSRLWFQGGIFAGFIEKAKLRTNDDRWYVRLPNELVTCPLCFSTEVTALLGLTLLLPRLLAGSLLGEFCQLTLFVIASMSLIPVGYIKSQDEED